MTALAEIKEPENIGLDGILGQFVERVKKDGIAEPVLFDLGCGRNPAAGFRGVDFYAEDADVRHDLFTGSWDFTPDDSVDIFFASHFIEHIPDWDDFFTKAWAKLKHGGYFVIITPYYLSVRATQDPDHKQMISRERYYYLSKDWIELNKLGHYNAKVDFELCGFYPCWNERFAARMTEAQSSNPDLAEYHMKHVPNAVDDLIAILRAKKHVVD